jgi:agmatinase
LKYLSNKKAFLGIDNKINVKEKVVVVPFGLEKTVSYGSGTNKGPREIIKASHQVELFDEDLNKEPYKNIGIKTLQPFPIKKKIEEALKQIESINKILLDDKKFPLVLGGEHSLTPGAIRPFVKKFGKLCLLHFDAHADLRNSYNGNKFSHASAIRRCLDDPNVNVVSFGIRNISSSEISFLKKNKKRIKIFWAKDKSKWDLSKFKKIIKNKKVYITFDVDGLDSSLMPATGTPEPGGLFWNETMNIIKIASQYSNIVGGDVNELSPIKGFDCYNFLAAKLAYKIISYSFEFKKKTK